AAQPLRRSLLLREFEPDRERPHDAGLGAVLQSRDPPPPGARQGNHLPGLPQPVPGERRGDEAVRAVREIPRARVPGEARSRPASHDASQHPLKGALRAAVAAGLTAFILWKSHPRDVLAALAHADWRLIAIAVLLVILDPAPISYSRVM